ncbi:bifunctional serine/threonine-protein kinase/formylglycine-generating enzyme family protein [Simiduia aestuariiviva]|uniref:Serine/threonine protein kinase n=1 Tax=Simiduia aestuariiviva TaxID=1510459 RepID=A0A839UTT0_9GAMM|nr:bifunctional serine/threonine-protein kinase/formylglycine-generating enzyme family protein [Simiduia aestuariiviva]MBB3168787.1 serine/threonine protein kinase [Simiduia aestuariiviva]
MDVEDKTRVVPSLTNAQRRTTRPDVTEKASQSVAAAADQTVFVPKSGKPTSPDVQPRLNSTPASITALDKTVLAGAHILPLAASNPSEARRTLIKDRFELVNLLGSGGMGSVYRALDRRKVEASDSDPYVAVKLLNDDFRQHPDAFISLQRESRKSQNLAHPNIVTVFDFDRDADLVFMTMEYLDGTPLDKLIRQNAGSGLEKERAEAILKDITSALMHAHSQRIVHSDFKPGNIFVTKNKGAKVFDFGIARAVSGELGESASDKTLFDAGSLGALTPAYASLEMIKGEEPCQSDDVYALGCVAYEMYAGRHPFNKTPADKACEQKLKPKRLKGITRRQWRALEAALAFRREDRVQDAAEFMRLFFGRNRAFWVASGVVLFSLVVMGSAFFAQYQEQKEVDQAYKAELEEKLQKELVLSRVADKKQAIERLIAQAVLSVDWERDLRNELRELKELSPGDGYPAGAETRIAGLFYLAAKEYIAAGELENAEITVRRADGWGVANAERFADVRRTLNAEKSKLIARLEEERKQEAMRIAAEERARIKAEQLKQQRAHEQKVNALVSTLERQLRCGFGMDIGRGMAASLQEMSLLDADKYQILKPIVAKEIASCLVKLSKENPRRSHALLVSAQQLLPNQPALAHMKIDFCGHLEPGSGGKGDRYTCADPLLSGGVGPVLVRVGGESRNSIAIGKFEVSWSEFMVWCNAVGSCSDAQVTGNGNLPVTGISVEQAREYTAWLSDQTGYNYRLPTYREWFGAAGANGEREQPDRNCYLKYGGIEKGGELIAANAGIANRNGLVNHVGNASEMVREGDELLAVGGSYMDSMSGCLATTKKRYDVRQNYDVGFRVVRDSNRR